MRNLGVVGGYLPGAGLSTVEKWLIFVYVSRREGIHLEFVNSMLHCLLTSALV